MTNKQDYIIIEGLDYCGKSTYIDTIKGRNTHTFVQEPSKYLPLENIRNMILKSNFTKQSNLLLSITQRIELFRLFIDKNLKSNIPVISDRSFISSMVYNSEPIMTPKEVYDLHYKLYEQLITSITKIVYMDISYEEFITRIDGKVLDNTEKPLLIENEYLNMQERYKYSIDLVTTLNPSIRVLKSNDYDAITDFIYN